MRDIAFNFLAFVGALTLTAMVVGILGYYLLRTVTNFLLRRQEAKIAPLLTTPPKQTPPAPPSTPASDAHPQSH